MPEIIDIKSMSPETFAMDFVQRWNQFIAEKTVTVMRAVLPGLHAAAKDAKRVLGIPLVLEYSGGQGNPLFFYTCVKDKNPEIMSDIPWQKRKELSEEIRTLVSNYTGQFKGMGYQFGKRSIPDIIDGSVEISTIFFKCWKDAVAKVGAGKRGSRKVSFTISVNGGKKQADVIVYLPTWTGISFSPSPVSKVYSSYMTPGRGQSVSIIIPESGISTIGDYAASMYRSYSPALSTTGAPYDYQDAAKQLIAQKAAAMVSKLTSLLERVRSPFKVV